MKFDKTVLLAVCVSGLIVTAGCSEKQYATGGATPAGSAKSAASAAPKDPMAKPGSDDPTAK